MARPARLDDATLLDRLMGVFREVGYEGASLARLAEAAGLQKASLYHRFPGGKTQMAAEALNQASAWLNTHLFEILEDSGRAPAERLDEARAALTSFYDSGRASCPLAMLAAATDDPFGTAISDVLERWQGAFTQLAFEAGYDREGAERAGLRALMLIQGALVLARGAGSATPFRALLDDLDAELLHPAG